jgi:pyruvate dehydrogenase E1 component beta subunit
MDFMLYAMDSIVNEAAKWSSMMGGQATAGVTIRAIINRGGEQGAQHSQSLHSWFTHIPGLRVVMPATAKDARDLLIAKILSFLLMTDGYIQNQTFSPM